MTPWSVRRPRLGVLLSLGFVALSACALGEADEAASDPIDATGGGGSSAPSSGGAGGVGEGGEGGAGPAGSGGAGGEDPLDPCPVYAAEVIEVSYGPHAGFGQSRFPEVVFGPPKGGGCCQGSLDVLTLGVGGHITLGFFESRIVDGPGPDFIVFENPFFIGGDEAQPFAELATVEVSADGETWHAYECTAVEPPYGSCAGWRPVYANPDQNDIDARDPEVAGGDAFDLADVGLSEARYVRIVDRADLIGSMATFDLDAVAIVHGACDAE